jgi:hypothetical protein
LVVVTAVEPTGVVLPSVQRVVEVDIDVPWRVPVASLPAGLPPAVGRLVRLARNPVGTVRRRLGLDAGSERSLAAATAAITRAVEELPADEGEATEVIALDGHDYLAVQRLVSSGEVRLFPGGLRRLADLSLTTDLGAATAADGIAPAGDVEPD